MRLLRSRFLLHIPLLLAAFFFVSRDLAHPFFHSHKASYGLFEQEKMAAAGTSLGGQDSCDDECPFCSGLSFALPASGPPLVPYFRETLSFIVPPSFAVFSAGSLVRARGPPAA